MIKSTLKFAVLKIKKRSLVLDEAITNSYLFTLCRRQICSFIRGFIHFRQFVSVGSSVSLSSTSSIECGKGVSIGSFSVIDGLGRQGLHIGGSSSIGSFSIIKVSGTLANLGEGIYIGSNVGIGEFAHIGGAGGVTIGDNTIAGAYLSIHPENHIFSDLQTLIRQQGVTRKGIKIGSNCWIGAKVTILDGSIVGNGCIIAAGAVVNGIFPDDTVIGGVPSRILKYRS
ncbi:acyltransferase [Shewanella sp. 10N.286.51.B2]|uniref:acyltransferase n=1 Tax=Shewanella sp. 10N.286.51.B2 TaxID=3229707 RepID=UPI00354EE04A